MPYVEILAPRASGPRKRELAGEMTRVIAGAFGVTASTVTIYFLPIDCDDYAHEGVLGDPEAGMRVFVKVHAYRRSLQERRAVAEAVTPAIAACFAVSTRDVAVYFMDRERDEVAHDGHMASDTGNAPSSTDSVPQT